ncbi:MAG: Ig-like domain-containing protein [Anaerolineae bacterium]
MRARTATFLLLPVLLMSGMIQWLIPLTPVSLQTMPELMPPRVLQSIPAPGEELPLDAALEIVFDRPMDAASVESAFQLSPPVAGRFEWVDAQTLRFRPAAAWERGQSYELNISQEARAQDQLPLREPFRLRFAAVGFLEVAQVIPADGTQDVDPMDAAITVMFNRPVVPLAALAAQEDFPQPLQLQPPVAGKGEWVNTSVYVFRPTGPLAGGSTYTATVLHGLTDTTGGLLAADHTWSFSTAPPMVVAVQPGDGAEMVSVRPQIQVQFNMAIDPASAADAFRLSRGGEKVPGELQVVGSTLYFTPTQQLEFDSLYQVEVGRGVRAAAGGPLGMPQDYTFTFRTVPLPEVVATDPRDGDQAAHPYTHFTIYFNVPIDPATVLPHLTFSPNITASQVITYYNVWDHSFSIQFGAQPSTEYWVAIAPGIRDPYGNATAQELTVHFRTAALSPDFRLMTSGLVSTYDATAPARVLVAFVNISELDLALYRLPPDLIAYPEWQWDEYRPPRATLVRRWREHLEAALNRPSYARIALVEGGGPLEPGLYLLRIDSPQLPKERQQRWRRTHVLVVSALNLTFKHGPREALVWATDLTDGAPVGALPVQLYNVKARRIVDAQTTDDQGVAKFTLDEPHDRGLIAYSQEPFAAVSSCWARGTDAWDFGLPAAYDWTEARVVLYTDRPIYRPGQKVYLKGALRAEDDAVYALSDADHVRVMIIAPNYEKVYETEIPLNDNGTFEGSWQIGEGAPLGGYAINAEFAHYHFQTTFQVAAYRPPEFQVTVTPALSEVVRGTPVEAAVEVRYFFGGGVAQVPVQWNLLAEPYIFKPPWGGGYTFSETDDPWQCFDCWWRPSSPPTPILSGNGTTDDAGRFHIAIPAELVDQEGKPIQRSTRFILEATATGRDNQAISGRASWVMHPGDFYAGLRAARYVGRAGEPFPVDLVTVDWQGTRLPDKALQLQVYRREWHNRYVEDARGGGHWEHEEKEIPVETIAVRTDARGEAVATFTPPQAGSYHLVVAGRDDAGREVRASLFVWVAGKERVTWRRENNDRFNLIADRTSYKPGEVAEILIPSPYEQPHYALVTVERNRIRRHEVVYLETNTYVYRLPIEPTDAPNIYVSVVLIKGTRADGRPAEYKVGLLPLDVSTERQELQVTITPARAKVAPGDTLECTVKVTDQSGEPLQAELSLDVVDKAVLSLMPRPLNVLREGFYFRRGVGIRTAASLAIAANRQLEELEQQLGLVEDEGEMLLKEGALLPGPTAMAPSLAREAGEVEVALPPGVTLRQEFADTAYWNPVVMTDSRGEARVSIPLPDNITTWVMRGLAINPATQVGEGVAEVIAAKPLLIRPITPRFLVAQDRVVLGAAVSNNTEKTLDVTVRLTATGISLQDVATQTVRIEAGREATVAWSAQVTDAPYADLAFVAIAQEGGYSDASKPRLTTGPEGTLAIYRYIAPDIVGTAGTLAEEGSVAEQVVPPRYDNRRGMLQVRVDPSLAASIRDGLRYLEHYPYECTEQTVSRFLPNVLTYRTLQQLGIVRPELTDQLIRLVEHALGKLYVQQNPDGGWGWWPERQSNPHVSAYVVFGLLMARQADFSVDEMVLQRGLDFLHSQLLPVHELEATYAANQQAWLLYVLAEAGQASADYLEELYTYRARLSWYARAYLAMALQRQGYGTDWINTLLSDLNSAAILSATGAHWEEEETDWWAMNSDTRTTAIVLDALVRLDPDNVLIPNAVRWLMVARKEAVWATTQETAWALIALTDWMRHTGELQAVYHYTVQLNGETLADTEVTPETVERSEDIRVDIAQLLQQVSHRLVIARSAGPGVLYYTAHLHVYLPVEQLPAVSRGIIVQRRYTLATCDQGVRCPDVKEVKVGDVIRVDLTLIAPHDLHYLVVEDMLPAGAEAIDTGLATTSLLAQWPQLRRVEEERAYALPRRWWHWYSRSELRDEKVVLFADYLPKGTYEYRYTMRATTPGDFHVIPTVAWEFYFPEVFGRSEGRMLSIGQPR